MLHKAIKPTRKQRELLQREELILNAAQSMIHEHGYAYLTMDRVAEAVEYSKGTIYNHFSSKEDLVCSLCSRSVTNLIDIFKRAIEYNGTTRERFSAIGIGYSLYHQLHPMDAQNIQIVKINAVREKVSDDKLKEMETAEQEITKIAMSVVHDAIDCGDLPKDLAGIANNIVFGCWSMHYGALLLDRSDIPLTDLGFDPTVQLLWLNTQKFLDGFGWLPLSSDNNNQADTDAMFKKLTSDLFADEINALKKRRMQNG
jgi:AcrR family transcriptional regulator